MRRLQDVGLVLLALLAGALSVLTFTAVSGPGTAGPGGSGEPGASARAGAAGLADLSRATPSVPDGATSTAGVPGDEGRTADGGVDGPRPDEARAVLDQDGPVVVAALGDSTGNETWEWVYAWGRTLASERPVRVVSWNEWTEDGYIDPVLLGQDAEGEAVTIYSGHQSGAGAAYPVERMDALVPEEPDLVILNFGHNDSVESVREGTSRTLSTLRERFGAEIPVVVTLQQPQADDANADVRRALAELATDEGLPTIDVAAAFEETGDPGALLADRVHPDEDGALLWARTVGETLEAP
ncbi:SGNH/GDSL hydrolase family protein [Ornithinimicrobium sp. W1665]|uniref:SGNH/GDSL hydrolase family protein n=1 Tax=Ornithinimicrobium sp. W1665 TaxID=3416666 RepID=UPI003CE6A1C2